MTIQGAAAVQEVPWATVNLLRPFFTPGLRPIAETVLTAPAASVTFANIPGNYRALVLLSQARADRAAEEDVMMWRANGDAGNNYDSQYGLWLANNTHSSGGAIAATWVRCVVTEAANSRANNFSPGTCWWPGYALTDREKQSFTPSTPVFGDVSGLADMRINYYAGRWRNTNAITSLTFLPVASPNLVAGSRFTLYGVL